MTIDREYGSIHIKLEELIKQKDISKNQLSFKSEVTRTQINRLCKGASVRADFNTLARLCCVLECQIGDLLEYLPPEDLTAER